MINYQKLDDMMVKLGHPENLLGTEYIRQGIQMRDAGRAQLTKDIYPGIARVANSTAERVERCMRTSIDVAYRRGDPVEWLGLFGTSAARARPTVGEYLARLARVCRED